MQLSDRCGSEVVDKGLHVCCLFEAVVAALLLGGSLHVRMQSQVTEAAVTRSIFFTLTKLFHHTVAFTKMDVVYIQTHNINIYKCIHVNMII